jgi:hypothetical protein
MGSAHPRDHAFSVTEVPLPIPYSLPRASSPSILVQARLVS